MKHIQFVKMSKIIMSQDKYVHDLQIAAICLSFQLNFKLSFCAQFIPIKCIHWIFCNQEFAMYQSDIKPY